MHWSERFVGIPFAWDGYGFDGCSCWGLLCLVQREVFGRHVPRHDAAVEAVRDGAGVPEGIWQSGVRARPVDLSEAAEGDVLHMLGGDRRMLHVGTFVSKMSVLHIERGTDSMIEQISRPRFAWRLNKKSQVYRLVPTG